MVSYLDENNELRLTESASMISTFKILYDSFEDPDVSMAYFSFFYYMYHFDSKFLREIPEESKRIVAVKKFVPRGSEIKVTKSVRKAMNLYKDLYADEAGTTYLIMRNNLEKLKNYADKMVLFLPPVFIDPTTVTPEDLAEAVTDKEIPVLGVDFILVESKEFASITSLLPKQQDELDKFEAYLIQSVKSKIDIYGGGTLGAYE